MIKIFDGICCLKNVGKKREQQYNKLGIYSINDLLWHIPRGYIDFTSSVLISELKPDELFAVKAMVLSKSATRLRANLNMYTIRAADGRQEIDIKLFNLFYTFNQIKIGGEYVFFGRVTKVGRFAEMNLIDYESTLHELRMRPIYRLTAGLSSKIVALNVAEALTLLQQVSDYMPLKFCRELNLATFEYAMKNMHFPKNKEALKVAGQRLAMDELIMFNIGLLKQRVVNEQTNKVIIKNANLNEFLQTVDFEPTNAQLKVIDKIFGDMKQGKAMNRLVQGDVGCGKTFVAAAAIFAVCKSGFQAAVMVPTELLALQHYNYLDNILKKLGIKVECICSAKKAKEKRDIALRLQLGEIDCLVGTHALLSDYVEFFNLGLVITDEQHKFGVKQREKLSNKGQNPHTLVMSATPIPRTLAMIMYDNLDISVIDEMPKTRIPIKTYLVDSSYRARVYSFIKKELACGHQCYIICPLIEQDELEEETSKENKAAIKYAEELKRGAFKDYEVACIHGKQTSEQKDRIMEEFKQNKLQVLVSTTVIEVGIDIANATVMLIENADCFGLAQLHQLRGRIGRGALQSYCVLLSDVKTQKVKERLAFMCRHNNGFEIAEYDLKSRGPGEFLGTKQHGAFNFKTARFMQDINGLLTAKNIAKEILKADGLLKQERNSYIKTYLEQKLVNN